MIIFQPEEERQVYDKKYLHADEKPFFVNGSHLPEMLGDQKDISLAICYELSVLALTREVLGKSGWTSPQYSQ